MSQEFMLKYMPPRKVHRGFTLMELMIVVIVIAILSSIALPAYYNQIQRSRRSSATTEILSTATLLQKCFTINVTYASPPCTVPVTHNTTDGNYTITLSNLTQTTFTITATPTTTGQQKTDACTSFTLDNTNTKSSTSTSTSTTCW